MIYALMSTYREDVLGLSAARSVLAGCDVLVMYEGAVGTPAEGGGPTPVGSIRDACEQAGVSFWHDVGEWDTDAAKRTAMLEFAQGLADPWVEGGEPLWCVWIDGDEVMLWSEYLPDYLRRAEQIPGAAAQGLRVVEFDGSVAMAQGRCIRGDLVKACVEGSYQIEMNSGMIFALPNEHLCVAGGVPVGKPDGEPVTVEDLARLRPPLSGEPHILHRTTLRSPERTARRLHATEASWYDDPRRNG